MTTEKNQQLLELRKSLKQQAEENASTHREIISILQEELSEKKQQIETLESAETLMIERGVDDVELTFCIQTLKEEHNQVIETIEFHKGEIRRIQNSRHKRERQWIKDFAFDMFFKIEQNEDYDSAVCPFTSKTCKSLFLQGWREAQKTVGFSIPLSI